MLGADHHGYIGRLKAVVAAFGDTPTPLEVLIGQTVKVRTAQVRMSKRAGNIVKLVDLLEGVGVDAPRYRLVAQPGRTPRSTSTSS